jgi:ABC-type sugar transport system substrate-binding protein
MKRWLLGVGVFLALVGCRNETPTTNTPVSAPASNGATGQKTIAGVGFQDDQFFRLVEKGMTSQAKKEGFEFSPNSSAGAVEKEMTLIDAIISKKVAALCVAPLSQKASIPALKRAHDAGIPIITFDSVVDADFPASSIRSDQVALGRPTGELAKKYIQEKLGGKAKIAIISYMSLAPEPASQRTGGFEEALKGMPGVQVVARQDAWLAPKAVTVVENILTAHPDLDLIWAANEGGTVGAVTAVKNAGKAGKIAVFGTDISEQMAGFLLATDGILQGVTGQKPFDIGVMAVETAVKVTKGQKVEKKIALTGVTYSRDKPDEIKKYIDYIKSVSQ